MVVVGGCYGSGARNGGGLMVVLEVVVVMMLEADNGSGVPSKYHWDRGGNEDYGSMAKGQIFMNKR